MFYFLLTNLKLKFAFRAMIVEVKWFMMVKRELVGNSYLSKFLVKNQVMKSQGIFVFIDQFGDQAVSHIITKLLFL